MSKRKNWKIILKVIIALASAIVGVLRDKCHNAVTQAKYKAM